MKIWCESCNGTGKIERDYGLWGELLKCDKCDGKGYNEVEPSISSDILFYALGMLETEIQHAKKFEAWEYFNILETRYSHWKQLMADCVEGRD